MKPETKKCPRYETVNSFEVKYCAYCRLNFNDKNSLKKIQKEKDVINQIPNEAIKSIIQKEIERKIKEIINFNR